MLKGTFALTGWDENALEEIPTKVTQATIRQSWAGEGVQGDVICWNVMHYAADGTATLVGLMRFAGSVEGRAGSFVAHGVGSYDGERVHNELVITPGSGTGDLEGVSGTGTSAAPKGPEGTWTLDLYFPSPGS